MEDAPGPEVSTINEEMVAGERLRITIVYVIAFVLYPLFGVLDYLNHRPVLVSLLILRAIYIVILAGAYIGLRYTKTMTGLTINSGSAYMAGYLAIVAMVVITGGASSPYYAGLCLVLLASAVLFTWPLAAAITLYSGGIVAYLIAVLLHPEPLEFSALANNLFFLVPSAFVATIGSVIRRRLLWADLRLRHELAASNRQLERLARHDPLTGLLNRRGLVEKLDEVLQLNKRYGFESVLALLDLDNFKHVNDQLGHAVGDELLRQIAATLKQNSRATDIVYRIGGDEFLVLFLNGTRGTCELPLHRMRSEILKIASEPPYSRIKVGASVGAMTVRYVEGSQTAEQLLASVDGLLYAAKHAGKNRISWDEAEEAG